MANKPESPEMGAATFGRLRAYLAQVKNEDGAARYPQSWIKEAIGVSPRGRARLDIVADLKLALIEDFQWVS